MIEQERPDKAIMYMAETPKEREELKKMVGGPNLYGHLMRPTGSHPKHRGYSRNRKATLGRRYNFIERIEWKGNPMHAIAAKKIGTGRYFKQIIQTNGR